uniref:Uncharacterized protein n=1 Tax=Wuchereria bancrofti TaxID=6293 RepID=A0A1I8EWB1_WUCBA
MLTDSPSFAKDWWDSSITSKALMFYHKKILAFKLCFPYSEISKRQKYVFFRTLIIKHVNMITISSFHLACTLSTINNRRTTTKSTPHAPLIQTWFAEIVQQRYTTDAFMLCSLLAI